VSGVCVWGGGLVGASMERLKRPTYCHGGMTQLHVEQNELMGLMN
jgi:hypothetical protein